MNFKIVARGYRRCDLVRVSGACGFDAAPQLEAALLKITKSGRFRIVVDLSQTNFLGSGGLQTLLTAKRVCLRYNRGDVVISGLHGDVRKVFDLVNLRNVFRCFRNTTDAVGSF